MGTPEQPLRRVLRIKFALDFPSYSLHHCLRHLGKGCDMFRFFVGFFLFFAASAAAQACEGVYETRWNGGVEGIHYITVQVGAGDCTKAGLELFIYGPDDYPVYSDSFNTAQLAPFTWYGAEEFQIAMDEWLSEFGWGRVTSELPPIAPGETLSTGEFPFERIVDAQMYDKLRSQDRPMVCFIQGLESQRCIGIFAGNGGIFDIGIQYFPG